MPATMSRQLCPRHWSRSVNLNHFCCVIHSDRHEQTTNVRYTKANLVNAGTGTRQQPALLARNHRLLASCE